MTLNIQTPEEPTHVVSRRAFIKGVIAAGATVSTSAYLFRGPALLGQGSMPGSVERLMTLNVNGQMRRVDVMKQETLAMTLRYKLGLTGTKLGCDRVRVRRVHRAHRRRAALLVLDSHAHGPRQEDPDHRGARVRRRHAAPRAAGRGGRAGLPVRVLHVGVHHGHGGLSQNQPEPDPRRAGARHLGQPVPVRGLPQDSQLDDARRREHAKAGVRLRAGPRAGGLRLWP